MIKKILLLITLVLLICSCHGCDRKVDFDRNYGKPIYRVTLLNNFGQAIDTKLAQEMYESCDWGMHKNYTFEYYTFDPDEDNPNWGFISYDTWEWSKSNVIIERLP